MTTRQKTVFTGISLVLAGFLIIATLWPLKLKGLALVIVFFGGALVALAGILVIEAGFSSKLAKRDAELSIIDLLLRIFGR
jgi:hypothetical protein